VPPLGPETPARIAPDDGVQPEPVGALLAHQGRALASRVSHGPPRLGVDVPLGQHAQAEYMGQPTRVGRGIRLLPPVVWWQRRRVGQRHPVSGCHQSLDEPVPGGGGRHHHTCEGGLRRGEGLQNRGQMMGAASLREPLGLLIESHDATVVGLQSTPAV
jgi:hypothetical protein